MAQTEPLLSSLPPLSDVPGTPRRLGTRLSLGHVAMLVAALLAGLLNYSLLRAQDSSIRVAVADRPIAAGAQVEAASFRFADVRIDDAVRATLLEPPALPAVEGWVAVTAIAPGELVRASDLRAPSAPSERRAMSLPVEPVHAVGGEIDAGDRVDVIEVRDGRAAYVLVDAPVLATSGGPGGATGLGGVGGFAVTLAVDDTSALRLAAAIRGGAVEVVRSTGATPVDAVEAATVEAATESAGG